jgi:hypothetical protein
MIVVEVVLDEVAVFKENFSGSVMKVLESQIAWGHFGKPHSHYNPCVIKCMGRTSLVLKNSAKSVCVFL